MQYTAWKDFNTGVWDKAVDVRDFIQRNYIPYEGDDSFLAGPTERTTKLWDQVMKLYEEEREKAACLMPILPYYTHYCPCARIYRQRPRNNRWFAN